MRTSTQSATRDPGAAPAPRWGNLSGRSRGDRDARGCPIILLHGLTFDHHMWDPVLDRLPGSHPAIALDLPGHGESPSLRDRGLRPVVDAIHDAVLDAELSAPIIAGHSIAGPLAAIYASQHPAAGVISIDAPIRFESLGVFFREMHPHLMGDAFASTWSVFQDSWHMDLLQPAARTLLAAGDRRGDDRLRQLVLSYQADILEGALDDAVRWRDDGMARLRAAAVPYVTLHTSTIDRADKAWLIERVPQAEILEWPVGHHFPHLADPDRFAALLLGLAAGCFAEAGR